MARKLKRQAIKVTQEIRDAMFTAFQEKQSFQYVADKVGVSWPTVARWYERDNWIERLGKIREKAQKKADNDAAEMRARHIGLAKIQQRKGFDFFRENKCRTAFDANACINSGIKNEREAMGEAGETIQQKFVVEIVRGDNDKGNQDPVG